MAETRRGHGVGIVAAIVGVVWFVAIGGSPAAAQEPTTTLLGAVDTVAVAIAADGWYADPAAAGDREQLAAIAHRPAPAGESMGFALLEAEPAGTSTVFAEEVLDALIRQGETEVRTVVVISPADVGAVSDVWDDAAIDRAFDDSIDLLRTNVTDGLDAFATALSREPTDSFGTDIGPADTDTGSDDESGGLPTGTVVLFVVLGLIAVVSWLRRIASGDGGYSDGADWDDDSYRDRSRWRRRSSLSSWGSSRRSSSSSGSRSRSRSSSRSSRGRGGRRL